MQSYLQYQRFLNHLQKQINEIGIEEAANVQRELESLDLPDKVNRRTAGAQSTAQQRNVDQNEKESDGDDSPSAKGGPRDISLKRHQANPKILVVAFQGPLDVLDPQNLSLAKKWTYTMIVCLTILLVSGAAAFDTPIAPQAARTFHVSQEVELLDTTMYMVGFGLGSMVSAPFSETVGRNPVYILFLTAFTLFTMGAGLAQNIETQIICRFFAALCGSPPITTFGGSMSDMWSPLQRTYVFPITSVPAFAGPFLAPMIADYIGTSPALAKLGGWRWTEWITMIFAGLVLSLIVLFLPETYAPVLLSWKAKHLREITGDDRYRGPAELKAINLGTRLLHSVARPVRFLFTELIVDLFALYLIIMYIILFGFLPGYDFIFGSEGIYGFDQQHTGLCFIAMNVGFVAALVPLRPLYLRFQRKLRDAQANETGKVDPEERLWFSMIGAPAMPISLFWMGWTSWPSVSYWSPLVASALFGFATLTIFISSYQYIIDSYEVYAASALVGVTVTRYCASGPMVIVSVPMYNRLGVHWTLTLLGCLSLLMVPVPFVLYRYGTLIRRKSRSATNFASH